MAASEIREIELYRAPVLPAVWAHQLIRLDCIYYDRDGR